MSEHTKYSAALRAAPIPVEEALQCRGLAFASDPQQTLAVAVDLIDQRQVALPAAARELVDGRWPRCWSGRGARGPSRRPCTRCPMDGVPRRGKRRGHLLPRQALGPPGKEPSVGIGQSVLAGGPWEGLDPHAAAWDRSTSAHRRRGRPRGCATGALEVEAPDRLRVVARGPAKWHCEHLARAPARGRTRTSMLSRGCSTSRTVS